MPRSPQNIRTPRRTSRLARAPSAATGCAADLLRELPARFAQALAQLRFDSPARAALAVSGGGDSLALMHLFAEWAKARSQPYPVVLIVDHGLREDSALQAHATALAVGEAGFSATVLKWNGSKPHSDIEAKARTGRYEALGKWSLSHGIEKIFVGHTCEDQAETFLLRLGRGSGVDGLSAMQPCSAYPVPGFERLNLLRPLLDFGRDELRAYLRAKRVSWHEDDMNSDVRFARVRVRQALLQLDQAGISVPRMVEAARHMTRAREALEAATAVFLARHACFEGENQALLDAKEFGGIPREIALRALSATLMRVSGATYRPRFERLSDLLDAILAEGFAGRTLLGCRVARARKADASFGPATLSVTRERPRKPR